MRAYDVPEGMPDETVLAAIGNRSLTTRLETAQAELRRFVQRRPDDRIGLIAFSTGPLLVSPPTLDHDFLLARLDSLDVHLLPDGTEIAAPVAAAVRRLKDLGAGRRIVVLFTDGENTVPGRISPRQAADLARQFEIPVYTVGIGGDRAVLRIAGVVGAQLRPVPSRLDRQALEDIAARSGGEFLAAGDAAAFAAVMAHIDRIETRPLEEQRLVDAHEQFLPWLLAGLALILAGYVIENTWLQALP